MALIGASSGELLRRTRTEHQLTQTGIALAVGTSQGFVSRVENGIISPTVDTLERLLDAAGADLVLFVRPSRSEAYERAVMVSKRFPPRH